MWGVTYPQEAGPVTYRRYFRERYFCEPLFLRAPCRGRVKRAAKDQPGGFTHPPRLHQNNDPLFFDFFDF